MSLIMPFAAMRPRAELISDVVAPPYDVVTRLEAFTMAKNKPHHFFHISRPEIDLPISVDPYDNSVYEMGKQNLNRFLQDAILLKDDQPGFYLYQLKAGAHQQTGLVCLVATTAYQSGWVRKHENTRPAKVQDRMRHLTALQCQPSPVMMAYRSHQPLDALLQAPDAPAVTEHVDHHGVQHRLWKIDATATLSEISEQFNLLDSIYIADGHHRCEASLAANVPAILAVIFPHNQLQTFGYHRGIRDLGEHSCAAFLEQASAHFDVSEVSTALPQNPRHYGCYIDGTWYQFRYNNGANDADLDVSLLQEQLLSPVLGINDPRVDPRIDFIGGDHSQQELEALVNDGELACVITVYPTPVEQMLMVSDQGGIMPPKSTWFEPKLADGLFLYQD